jgi:hypothetical protein
VLTCGPTQFSGTILCIYLRDKTTLTPIFLKDIRYKFSDTNLKGSAKVNLIGGATVDV